MIGSELLWVPAGNHLPQPHDGGGMIPVPIQDCFPDVPAAGSFQTLGPTLLPSTNQRTLSEYNTP